MSLETGTYEIIQGRLEKQKKDLLERLEKLNNSRKEVFGAVDLKIIANKRINTDNNCIARDIISFGNTCLLGYNVHIGLRSQIKLSDVFSAYQFENGNFKAIDLTLINDEAFINDFENLYKYYRDTIFARFAIIGNYVHMVFQISDKIHDIKTFKWLLNDNQLRYIDNRSDFEYGFPNQHEFEWKKPVREMHRYGTHAHVSILDKVFVETIGGDLTIKIEDNTDIGQGIFSEPVEFQDQTLDDAEYFYADLGNLIILKIKPYQEDFRYFVYNHKVQEVYKIDSIKDATVLLPENQGILFPNGYYLQTGTYKLFEKSIEQVKFLKRLAAPNGEDFIFVFYEEAKGDFVLIFYNIIDQEIKTPIICNGYTVFPDGELSYFKAEEDATKHHVIQIWQTPFTKKTLVQSEHSDRLIYKIGNKDLVKAMAESRELIGLLNKEDSYDGLYDDIAKLSGDIVDSYYWIHEPETAQLSVPLSEIQNTANTAIDEFEKVIQLKKQAKEKTDALSQEAKQLFDEIKHARFQDIQEFVEVLANLRLLRGNTIGLKDIRYTENAFIEALENEIVEKTGHISTRCVDFLMNAEALLPYTQAVKEKEANIEAVKKVIDGKKLHEELEKISADLELLIDIVNNLEIEDTAHSTQIIDGISVIFAELNRVKASLKRRLSNLGTAEAQADFTAQIKLFDQSVLNALDLSQTPEKCDEYLTKLSVQLEEIEGKFAEYDEFVNHILEKREEIYSAFETRKNALIEKRNKRSLTLSNSADRILKGVRKKAQTFRTAEEIHAYFAADIMVAKIHDIIQNLNDLEDSGKAEQIASKLKISKEESLRKLKDKLELYEEGDHIIRFGNHRFGVNQQPLDLSIVEQDHQLFFHLSGSDFYEQVKDENIRNHQSLWNAEYVSENTHVYRSEYLAFQMLKKYTSEQLLKPDFLKKIIKEYTSKHYTEGYTKGVHDSDAETLVTALAQIQQSMGLLKFSPEIRGKALWFWKSLNPQKHQSWQEKISAAQQVLQLFPKSENFTFLIDELEEAVAHFYSDWKGWKTTENRTIALYLFEEFQKEDSIIISRKAEKIYQEFIAHLQNNQAKSTFTKRIEKMENLEEKVAYCQYWLSAFIQNSQDPDTLFYIYEIIALILFDFSSFTHVNTTETLKEIALIGAHPSIKNGSYTLNYHSFFDKLTRFEQEYIPQFLAFKNAKQTLLQEKKASLKLNEFKPKVLASFVRNKLIDQVYLPLFGSNLAKQLGTVGDNKRVDRMGMLLLISPPGYGKTTLMEYIANRMGMTFMKINGPAIGHEVTSVDPMSANNSAAREELKKLNLAFEMGNNVMLYLDDIQHCNPEFLQKFISLADGQRKIEGVYNGQPKTYDFREKKFCIIMAGNPYTESGEKFQIPDMLTNRSDIYNLGDIIGESAQLFELSMVENALSSNTILRNLSTQSMDDLYEIIHFIEGNKQGTLNLKGNHSKSDIETYVATLEKLLKIRDIVLQVNKTYIESASMDDAYRTEPSFKLQGSYRDMNKLAEKILPIMNAKELEILVNTHYENESQTLTSASEANLLKYKELTKQLTEDEIERWKSIKQTFKENQSTQSDSYMQSLLEELAKLTDGLDGIKGVLGKR
ncbi:MAG: DNA repair ATPase [Flavobacteriales bacterium]|jgi:hypothetical protein|nr:DNA repair ATPase [Flavobacteriales bacterium]